MELTHFCALLTEAYLNFLTNSVPLSKPNSFPLPNGGGAVPPEIFLSLLCEINAFYALLTEAYQ